MLRGELLFKGLYYDFDSACTNVICDLCFSACPMSKWNSTVSAPWKKKNKKFSCIIIIPAAPEIIAVRTKEFIIFPCYLNGILLSDPLRNRSFFPWWNARIYLSHELKRVNYFCLINRRTDARAWIFMVFNLTEIPRINGSIYELANFKLNQGITLAVIIRFIYWIGRQY